MTHALLALAAAMVLPALAVWLVMRGKLRRLDAETSAAAEKQRAEAASALKAEQSKAAAQVAEAKQSAAEVAAKLADVEQRFATHREVADRRQTNDSQEIERLETDLAAAREVAAQLAPTQARIKDLETALAAEQGRVKAQEQAIQATSARAADFEKRLAEAQELVMRHKTEMQEVEAELKKVRDEQAAYLAAGGVEAELAKAREAQQQAEAKIVQLNRSLKAAETRAELVQKEFMNAVGVASAPTPGVPATASGDKKVRELEEKLTQLEAESRKRAREDGYKIAELEYRLSEALESVAKPADAGSKSVPPSDVPKADAAPVAEVEPGGPKDEGSSSEAVKVPEPQETPLEKAEEPLASSADPPPIEPPARTLMAETVPIQKVVAAPPEELPLGDRAS